MVLKPAAQNILSQHMASKAHFAYPSTTLNTQINHSGVIFKCAFRIKSGKEIFNKFWLSAWVATKSN